MVDWEDFYGSFRKPGFLPGYEIQNHLGGGAFGEVYKAVKTSIGKTFAIKFLRVEAGASQAGVERELEQVRLFASIDHPNLVTIEDMGVVGSVPYLIMGYAGEDTLARRIHRGDLDPESALRTFVQTCRGVLALHDRRLAHFDLKPGNIFLNGDVARVGDYGLAKLLNEGQKTLSFGRGTPHYMAPEMLRSRADLRADIYSLGVILFESLSFRLPFGNREDGMIVREDDRPPDFPLDFPSKLRGVVERALRLDPKHRYASVYELLEDMGQTARQGDSIRLDEIDVGRPRSRPPLRSAALSSELGKAREPATPTPKTPGSKDELRKAAAELARGAVDVAKGVWSGVTERVSSGDAAAQADDDPLDELVAHSDFDQDDAGALPAAGLGDDVLAVSGLAENPPRASGRSRSQSRIHTIPVPPRAEGGWMGTLTASFVLGAEVLGALISGPVLALLRRLGYATDTAVRRVPGAMGGLLRLGLLLFFLACLGGFVSFVILTLTTLKL